MGLSRFRMIGALAVALGLTLAGVGYSLAQNAGQVLSTLGGTELIQAISPNTAAVTYVGVDALRDGRSYLYNAPTTGFSLTLAANQSAVSLNPAGTLATGTITLPPATVDGMIVSIFSSQTITSLTLSASGSATITNGVTTLTAGSSVAYVYNLSGNKWYRIW